MKTVKVTYSSEVVSENKVIDGSGAVAISFENIGTDTATIDKVIPLAIGDAPREFKNEDPQHGIVHKFTVSFANAVADKQVLVIKTFKEISNCNK